MHAKGKALSITVPAMPEPAANSGWDVEKLATIVDHLHVMGYDFHTVGTHGGPLAPRAVGQGRSGEAVIGRVIRLVRSPHGW